MKWYSTPSPNLSPYIFLGLDPSPPPLHTDTPLTQHTDTPLTCSRLEKVTNVKKRWTKWQMWNREECERVVILRWRNIIHICIHMKKSWMKWQMWKRDERSDKCGKERNVNKSWFWDDAILYIYVYDLNDFFTFMIPFSHSLDFFTWFKPWFWDDAIWNIYILMYIKYSCVHTSTRIHINTHTLVQCLTFSLDLKNCFNLAFTILYEF